MRWPYFILLISLLMASTGLPAQEAPSQQTLKSKKFSRLAKKPNTIILDVRTAEEYQAGHIAGALNMDVQKEDFLKQVQSLDTTKRYLLYCRSGKRSAKALNLMQQNGFKNVYHLKGGIEAWKGYIEKPQPPQ